MTTAEKVRALIAESGHPQKEFAASVGIHPVTLSKGLSNDDLSMKSLKKIADWKGISVAALMPDKKRMTRKPKQPSVNGYIEFDGKIEAVRSVEDLERVLLALKENSFSISKTKQSLEKGKKPKGQNTPIIPQRLSGKSLELKAKLDELIEQEHKSTEALKDHPSYYPVPTRKDLFDSSPLKYDSSRYLCVAFRSKPDHWKDMWVPLGNMNGGFDYEICGTKVKSSEHAYILGIFSTDSKKHLELQQKVLAEPSGYQAKHNIRMKNRIYSRLDWHSYNIDWMLYCVWAKIKQNQNFRNLLLSIPEGATIIEDNSLKNQVDKYWGCYNPERKPFANLARRFAKSLDLPTKAARDRVSDKLIWDFCNYGIFEGTNEMGRILTYLKDCLHKGVEPEIDYDLLNKKNIHILGKRLHFDINSGATSGVNL